MKEIFNRNNFHLLNEILDKEPELIECGSVTNPKEEIFNQPIKNGTK